jgi:outer membrane protein assembly factor BamB
MSLDPQTGEAASRAQLTVYDAGANSLWSLPELPSGRFYAAALLRDQVIAGLWPSGFWDNYLAAYDLFTGEQIWRITAGRSGFQQIAHQGDQIIVLLDDEQNNAIVSYDALTGGEQWRWSDPEKVLRPERILLGANQVFLISADGLVALDAQTGSRNWQTLFSIAPQAGVALFGGTLVLTPAPTVDLGFRPGVVGIDALTGTLAWHSLIGLVVDPLAADGETLWVIARDYDEGLVVLSGLEMLSGLERVRINIEESPDTLLRLTADESRVFVMGEQLRAYGY